VDLETLIAGMEFARARVLETLGRIEGSGGDAEQVMQWRPGPGIPNITWHAMHCAATHHKYERVVLGKGSLRETALVAAYGGSDTQPNQEEPSLEQIRDSLANHFESIKAYLRGRPPNDLMLRVPGPGTERSIGEWVILLAWHEAHHQGQMHLTWNLYRQAHAPR